MIIKGVLDPQDARDAVKSDLRILVDSGIRNGLDIVRAIALGADDVMLAAPSSTPWRRRGRLVSRTSWT